MMRPENSRDLYKLTGKRRNEFMILADSFLFFLFGHCLLKTINLIPLYSTLPIKHLFFASHQVLQHQS